MTVKVLGRRLKKIYRIHCVYNILCIDLYQPKDNKV